MSRMAYLGGVAVLLLVGAEPQREMFSKYKSIEAYEVRPGIIAMPRRAEDGQVCEIGLEKLHYSPETISVDSGLSRKEIAEIFDEFVPSEERGPQPRNPIEQMLGGGISGHAMVSAEQYQNVSIYIYGALSADALGNSKTPATLDEVAATLKWKNRHCR